MLKSNKPYRIRVRASNGVPTTWQTLKTQLGSFYDVFDVAGGIEFVVGAVNEKQIEQVRAKLGAAGLEELPGADTAINVRPGPRQPNERFDQRRRVEHRNAGRPNQHGGPHPRERGQAQPLCCLINKLDF